MVKIRVYGNEHSGRYGGVGEGSDREDDLVRREEECLSVRCYGVLLLLVVVVLVVWQRQSVCRQPPWREHQSNVVARAVHFLPAPSPRTLTWVLLSSVLSSN